MSIETPVPARNAEAAALFNPAFCAYLVNRAVAMYEDKAGKPMPITFPFLILPSALHKPTREALPLRTTASMWTWLGSNPVQLMDFADRARGFRRFTGAAIGYGFQHGVLKGSVGALTAGTIRRRPKTLHPTEDWTSCLKAAEFLGRWFGSTAADEATVLARWGVRP